jgi:uncharacterized protein (TIGR02246 family)
MLTRTIPAALIVLALSTLALADNTTTQANVAAQALSASFAKAFAACDQQGIEDLYEDDAVAIYPGVGEQAKGKVEIAKMAIAACKTDIGKQVSADAKPLGADYIINVGRWESTTTGPDGKPVVTVIRTTELIHNSDGKWRYAVDHGSVGTPGAMGAQLSTSNAAAAASSPMAENTSAMTPAPEGALNTPAMTPMTPWPTSTPTETPTPEGASSSSTPNL